MRREEGRKSDKEYAAIRSNDNRPCRYTTKHGSKTLCPPVTLSFRIGGPHILMMTNLPNGRGHKPSPSHSSFSFATRDTSTHLDLLLAGHPSGLLIPSFIGTCRALYQGTMQRPFDPALSDVPSRPGKCEPVLVLRARKQTKLAGCSIS